MASNEASLKMVKQAEDIVALKSGEPFSGMIGGPMFNITNPPKVEVIPPHSTPIVALRCTYCGAALEAKESPPWTCEYCNTVFVGGPDSSPSYQGQWENRYGGRTGVSGFSCVDRSPGENRYGGRTGVSGFSCVDRSPELVSLLQNRQIPMSEASEALGLDFDAAKEFLARPSGYGDTEQEVERKEELLDVIKKGLEKKEKRHLFWPF